jgi:hypothetical protein
MNRATITRKLLVSSISVGLAITGFWGLCLLVSLMAGAPIASALPHKVAFVISIVALQMGMMASDPLRKEWQVWLRATAAVAASYLSSLIFFSVLTSLGLIEASGFFLWIGLTSLFAILFGASLVIILKKKLLSGQ